MVQARHRVYIHLAIVLLDILCNILPLGLIVWEMVDFHRVAACHNFNSEETFGNHTSYLVLNDIGILTIHKMFPNCMSECCLAAEFLLVLNSSINFLVYVVLAPRFRQ